ncbi:RecQ family ATP-dependent DNA helicase [Parvicella tangerina]|uniref:ATP-dependent DNA helicase RecQ n=1 Tax=Parvicella tangerina TaxID=2829795 RepID=A0A916JLG9_9FLAO|nr:ATP-dependent DNA helicase RecQ [Parvicella tangerina]CAG5079878.1 ATP-dependent RNA helicase SrmB [Parvicella tangerina]
MSEFWGYDSFRDKQEEIISSIMAGKDTLALLPTGGGKSLCFQVPALCMHGVCIVVTPLVALMNDQVQNLKKRGVKALAIHSGMSKRQIDYAFDNVVYGGYRFLYLSPERLKTHLFKERLKKMVVSFIAVDEAHCISQWGYDFRPSYLDIPELRELLPEVPVLALTATATPRVVEDIQDKLNFRERNVLRKSFYRSNLRYFVNITENKVPTLLSIIKKQGGSGIVYLRSRKLTVEYAHILKRNHVAADYYHAGLTHEERERKQQDWQNNRIQVIVCTNAFGMGIDKPDVRFVVNLDLPESIEAYFQEAGRAGRDQKKAFAVLLATKADELVLRDKVDKRFPDMEVVKRVYALIMNHFRLAIGAGEMESYEMKWQELVDKSTFTYGELYHSAKFIERAGYWQLSEGLSSSSEVMITSTPSAIYQLQVKNEKINRLMQVLLRSYGGLFDGYVSIREGTLASRAKISRKEVIQILRQLHALEAIDYKEVRNGHYITLLQPRVDVKYLRLPMAFYHDLKKVVESNAEAMIKYVFDEHTCRSKMLLNYFGERKAENCGVCDYCLKMERKREIVSTENTAVVEEIREVLNSIDGVTPNELISFGASEDSQTAIRFAIQWMLDNGIILADSNQHLILKEA